MQQAELARFRVPAEMLNALRERALREAARLGLSGHRGEEVVAEAFAALVESNRIRAVSPQLVELSSQEGTEADWVNYFEKVLSHKVVDLLRKERAEKHHLHNMISPNDLARSKQVPLKEIALALPFIVDGSIECLHRPLVDLVASLRKAIQDALPSLQGRAKVICAFELEHGFQQPVTAAARELRISSDSFCHARMEYRRSLKMNPEVAGLLNAILDMMELPPDPTRGCHGWKDAVTAFDLDGLGDTPADVLQALLREVRRAVHNNQRAGRHRVDPSACSELCSDLAQEAVMQVSKEVRKGRMNNINLESIFRKWGATDTLLANLARVEAALESGAAHLECQENDSGFLAVDGGRSRSTPPRTVGITVGRAVDLVVHHPLEVAPYDRDGLLGGDRPAFGMADVSADRRAASLEVHDFCCPGSCHGQLLLQRGRAVRRRVTKQVDCCRSAPTRKRTRHPPS